jgi:hypothetical protein
LYTLATIEEVIGTGVATLIGAGLGAWGAIRAGKRAADVTTRAEAARQRAAREEEDDTRRAAARVVELQLTQTLRQFQSATEKNWLPVAFDIPSWDDIRIVSRALRKEDWSTLADAMRWLRYIRTLAVTVAGTSTDRVSRGESEMVSTDEIEADLREALPHLEAAVDLVKRHAGDLAIDSERMPAGTST